MTKITNWFTGIWTYYNYYKRCKRIQSDWQQVVAEWNRIRGFEASTEQLLDFLDRMCLYAIEYATWTAITWDDDIARLIRSVLTTHRDIITVMIGWVRRDHVPTREEMEIVGGLVSTHAEEYGSPMMVLQIVSTIFHVLVYLKSLRTDGQVTPDTMPDTAPPKRPVIHFVRKIFNRT
jgi:hypothetical protein